MVDTVLWPKNFLPVSLRRPHTGACSVKPSQGLSDRRQPLPNPVGIVSAVLALLPTTLFCAWFCPLLCILRVRHVICVQQTLAKRLYASEKEEKVTERRAAERTKTGSEIRSGKSRENIRFLRKQPVTETGSE